MIFVSPDESGWRDQLNVREGDDVKAGVPLYSLDDDLQLAISTRIKRRLPTHSRPTTAHCR